jgi:hypothetical protein
MSMPLAGFEPAMPATKQPQTYALDRAARSPLYQIKMGDSCHHSIRSILSFPLLSKNASIKIQGDY